MSHLLQGALLWVHDNYLLATLKPCTTLLKRGIATYQLESSSSDFHHPDVNFVSQLERCSYVSLHELILSCSIFEKIDPSRVFPSLLLSCWLEFSEQDIETKMVIESTFL